MWLEPVSLTAIIEGIAYLEAPERIRVWVQRRYSTLIADALGSSAGQEIRISFDQPPEVAGSTRTTVSGPDGEWVRYHYGNTYRYNEGKLLQVDSGTGPPSRVGT